MKLSLGSVQDFKCAGGLRLTDGLAILDAFVRGPVLPAGVQQLCWRGSKPPGRSSASRRRCLRWKWTSGPSKGSLEKPNRQGKVRSQILEGDFTICTVCWFSLLSKTVQPVVVVFYKCSTIYPFVPEFVFLVCWAPSLGVLENCWLCPVYVGSQMYLVEFLKV